MHKKLRFFALTLVTLGVSITMQSQALPTVADTPENLAEREAAKKAAVFFQALHLRETAAAAIMSGTEKPAEVIVQLKANASPSGLSAEANADFGMAALDIGQRLVAQSKLAEADIFFRECEKSFIVASAKVADADARGKAMILQKLALIRSCYLGEPAQAKADIEAAIKLQPSEKYFQNFRNGLFKDQAQALNNSAQN
ncbi:MAG TPA: hypothetical protein VGM66_05725 [Candidatus Udaeobacter sp.]|jgi:hypothetical protein